MPADLAPVTLEELKAKLEAAMLLRPAYAPISPARYAVLPGAGADVAALGKQIAIDLAPLQPHVAPLSKLDRRVLVVTFGERILKRDTAPVFDAAYALTAYYGLEAAEPAYPTEFFDEPYLEKPEDGPKVEGQGAIPGCEVPRNRDLPHDWALTTIRAREAWALSKAQGRPAKGEGVIFAQIDTGMTDHAEMRGVGRLPSHDFVDDDRDPTDPLNYQGTPGHGTGTGSVVVSPGSGVVTGAAPAVRYMPVRAVRTVGLISQVEVARAIDFAVDAGTHVISMSLGGLPSFALQRAVRRATAADVIVLAAAGNCVIQVVFPARYDECIAVAGVNHVDLRWSGSCRGPSVDISGPAENVWIARAQKENPSGGAVDVSQGTSFAVALTASAAALWLAHHGRANLIAAARQHGDSLQNLFRRMVRATARRPLGWDSQALGAGIVNCEKLLAADLDFGRDTEAALGPPPRDAAQRRVRQFVLEAAPDAPPIDPEVDLTLFGPEIVLALMRRNRGSITPEGLAPEAALARPQPRVSPALASLAGRDAGLSQALGLMEAVDA